MENDIAYGRTTEGNTPEHAGVAWRDLREWLALVDRSGELKQIDARGDPNEELGAITFLAARQENAQALLFNNLGENPLEARILSNMLGASNARYAIAMGLDPQKSVSELIEQT